MRASSYFVVVFLYGGGVYPPFSPCQVRIGQRVLTTIVVDIKAKELPEPEECRDYEPGVFAFPVPKLGHGDVIEAKLQYFQPMIFLDDLQGQGSYFISVPLPPSVQSGQVLHLHVSPTQIIALPAPALALHTPRNSFACPTTALHATVPFCRP